MAQSRVNRSLQIDDTFTYYLPQWYGEHEFRVGFQYSKREEEFSNFGTLNGQFEFDVDAQFDPNNIDTYPISFVFRALGAASAPIPENETLGIFLQDDWRVNDRLTLNLGVRYDKEDITDDNDNIAPRVGFTWQPFGDERTVVRGGLGRYYDRFQLGFWGNFFLDSVSISQGFIVSLPDAGEDQQFFFDTAQANGLTTLSQLRDFLISNFDNSDVDDRINPSPTVDNPNRKQAYADTFSLGFEREVWSGIAVGMDYIHTKNRDTLLLVNLNPFSSALGGRPNLSILNGQPVQLSNVSSYVNEGESDYDALQLSLRKRFNDRLGGRISYTISDSEGNYGNAGGWHRQCLFSDPHRVRL